MSNVEFTSKDSEVLNAFIQKIKPESRWKTRIVEKVVNSEKPAQPIKAKTYPGWQCDAFTAVRRFRYRNTVVEMFVERESDSRWRVHWISEEEHNSLPVRFYAMDRAIRVANLIGKQLAWG